MTNTYLIYKFTSPSGKSYIGQTLNLSRRISQHKHTSSLCSVFHNAIDKYGFDNFKLEILAEHLTLDEANFQEEKLIRDLNTLVPNGYNVKLGGNNYEVLDETRRKLSNASKGKPKSDHHKQKLSIAKSGKPGKMKGVPRLESTKQKISNARKGKSLSKESIKKRTNTRAGQKWRIDSSTGKRIYYFPEHLKGES